MVFASTSLGYCMGFERCQWLPGMGVCRKPPFFCGQFTQPIGRSRVQIKMQAQKHGKLSLNLSLASRNDRKNGDRPLLDFSRCFKV